MAAGHPDDEYTQALRRADDDLHWKALLRHFIPSKPIIAAVEGYAVAGGTEILQAMDIRVAGRVGHLRRGRGAAGPVPARRVDRAPVAADPLHDRGRAPADRPLRAGRGGAASRAHRPRGARRPGARQGPRDRRRHRGQRPARRAGGAASRCGPPASCPRRRAWPSSSRSAGPCSLTNDAKEGPTAFAEKRPPTSPAPDA